MAAISDALLEDITDSLAAQYLLLQAQLGDGSGSTSISAGAASILAGLLATEDYDIDPLWDAASIIVEKTKCASATLLPRTGQAILRPMLDALKADLSNDIDAELTTRSMRVHEAFNDLYYDAYESRLSVLNVFPVVTILRTVVHLSTLALVSAIDANEGPAQLEVEVINQTIGAPDWVLTLTCQKQDLTTEDKVVTVLGTSVVGTKFDVGASSDVYMDVTAVSATGGTAGDDVQIQTQLERSILLIVP